MPIQFSGTVVVFAPDFVPKSRLEAQAGCADNYQPPASASAKLAEVRAFGYSETAASKQAEQNLLAWLKRMQIPHSFLPGPKLSLDAVIEHALNVKNELVSVGYSRLYTITENLYEEMNS